MPLDVWMLGLLALLIIVSLAYIAGLRRLP
jgi:hypothetical protein